MLIRLNQLYLFVMRVACFDAVTYVFVDSLNGDPSDVPLTSSSPDNHIVPRRRHDIRHLSRLSAGNNIFDNT